MTIPQNVLSSFKWFRAHGTTTPAKWALACARAEAWKEENSSSVRVRWEQDADPDFSYLDQEDCFTPEQKKEVLSQYRNGYLTVEGCIVEILKVTPACPHCGSSEKHAWEQVASLWGIELVGHEGEKYRRWQEAELLLEAMPAEGVVAA